MTRFLTFQLDGEEYGVEILDVHEIIGKLPITRVPLTSDCVRGVINLRGSVIPVIDLKRKFGLRGVDSEACIVVVRVRGIELGLLVDRVSDVVELGETVIQAAPPFLNDLRADYLIGLARIGERVCLLLDIERAVLEDNRLPAHRT